MYSYTWDEETGGLLLNTTPSARHSDEPRPVYAQELTLLGFDRHCHFDPNEANPYMWAEANKYIYRGRIVARAKGGSLYTAPELAIEPEGGLEGKQLIPVDIGRMVERNRDLMGALATDTIRRIYNTYVEYQERIDVFYVAYSGGKDSMALLDLVQRALPHNNFKVVFGDTGMEFPDTYVAVKLAQKECKKKGIEFIWARSHFTPEETWRRFGPPATVTRWCCSVHKTAPQILAMRKLLGKSNFTGMGYIGVRAAESAARSEYDYVCLGEKHKGQYTCNPILEWNSAELYLYLYSEGLHFNEAYKKGNRRAGCLVCPGANEQKEYAARANYTPEFDALIGAIKERYASTFASKKQLDGFIEKGGWKARKNGRDLDLQLNYYEENKDGYGIIKVITAKTKWREWIKSLGVLHGEESPYRIAFRGEEYSLEVIENNDDIEVRYEATLAKANPTFVKMLKGVFRKTACCIGCRVCEADCHAGCLSMKGGIVSISDDCVHCCQCHKVETGCLVYKSLALPKVELMMIGSKSLNCYSHHAPRMDWFEQYFRHKNEFDREHTLGTNMFSNFKCFLRHAELRDKKGFTPTAQRIEKIGLEKEAAWAIMLTNLVYNSPQIYWVVARMTMQETYKKDYAISLLVGDGANESWVGDVWGSFARLAELPFSMVGFGKPTKERGRMTALTRIPWANPHPLVILYSLYRFAEACGGYHQFTLTRLMDETIERDGVSPTQIFGIERIEMEKLLSGLASTHAKWITVSFTHDLETINLTPSKHAVEVLELF